MPTDWNIVDDTPAEEETASSEPDDRLNPRRIRLIVLERRAAHRRRLWTLARAALCVIVAATIAQWIWNSALPAFRVGGALCVALLLWRAWIELRAWRKT